MNGENTENNKDGIWCDWQHNTNLKNAIKSQLSVEFEEWLNERIKYIPQSVYVLYQGEEKTIEEMFEIYKFIKSNN